MLSPGDMMLMYGSTIFIILITAERVKDGRLWYAPWLFPGQHAAMSGLATSGTLTHWFRDQLARDLDPATAFVTLTAEAEASPPGARGLVVLPYFSGERTPIHDPHAKGMLFGLDLTHTRGDIYRALLEGNAYATRHILDTYAELGVPPQDHLCGRRWHQERRLVGRDFGCLGARASRAREDHGCLLWRCVPRRARRRRHQARGDQPDGTR